MASAEAALIAALKGNAGLAAIVGSRVFVFGGRQGADYPYVTIQRISTTGANRLDGANTLEWPRFQIDSWGTAALDALTAAEAVRRAIDNITVPGDPTITGTFQNQDGPRPDEETRNFRVSQDFLIFHER